MLILDTVLDRTELENLSNRWLADDHPNVQNDPNTNNMEIEDKGKDKDDDKDEDADLIEVQTCKLRSKISSELHLAKTPTSQSFLLLLTVYK